MSQSRSMRRVIFGVAVCATLTLIFRIETIWANSLDQAEVPVASISWWPTQNVSIPCAVTLPSNESGPIESVFKCSLPKGANGDKSAFELQPGGAPVGFLNDPSGILIAIWSGATAYIVQAFVFREGKIAVVLNKASDIFPELVSGSNSAREIIVASPEDRAASGSNVDQALRMVTVLHWDGSQFLTEKKVRWTERFVK